MFRNLAWTSFRYSASGKRKGCQCNSGGSVKFNLSTNRLSTSCNQPLPALKTLWTGQADFFSKTRHFKHGDCSHWLQIWKCWRSAGVHSQAWHSTPFKHDPYPLVLGPAGSQVSEVQRPVPMQQIACVFLHGATCGEDVACQMFDPLIASCLTGVQPHRRDQACLRQRPWAQSPSRGASQVSV